MSELYLFEKCLTSSRLQDNDFRSWVINNHPHIHHFTDGHIIDELKNSCLEQIYNLWASNKEYKYFSIDLKSAFAKEIIPFTSSQGFDMEYDRGRQSHQLIKMDRIKFRDLKLDNILNNGL